MSPDTWHELSVWLLRAGFLFLIAAVGCSVRFNLISMIKSEINERKNRKFSDNEAYFNYVERQNKAENRDFLIDDATAPVPESSSSGTVATRRTAPESPSSGTVVTRRTAPESPSSGTVVTRRMATSILSPEQPSSATVVVHRTSSNQENNSEFVLLENIIVIHGNPEKVHGTIL
ncbi:MAG: hypothetical protein E7496_08170 [Ruminococcus sp.]|nr:hypothetical protein [Ruminococcus sp.]